MSGFVFGWSRRDEYGLSDLLFELVELEGTILHGGGESESVVHEILFPCSITRIHPTDLGDCHMRLIDECEESLWKEFHQCCWWFSDIAITQIHTVVLDTVDVARLREHLEIILDPHLDPLCLDELAMFCEELHLLLHLVFYFWYYALDDSLLRDKMLRWEYHNLVHIIHEVVCEVLDTRYPLECITEKLEPNNRLTRTRPDLKGISLHQEHPRLPVGGRSRELYHHELLDDILYHILSVYGEFETLSLVLIDLTDTIDT